METYLALITIKSQTTTDQMRIIDDVAKSLIGSAKLEDLRSLAVKEEYPNAAGLSDREVIELFALVIYVADIGTVPAPDSRSFHLSRFEQLCARYGLSPLQVKRLSVHGDFCMRWFERMLPS